MTFFPKVDYIDVEPDSRYGVWEDKKKGGQYNNGTIIIFTPFELWGNQPIWLARTIFHEFLHHIFDSMRCQFLNRVLHYPPIRRII